MPIPIHIIHSLEALDSILPNITNCALQSPKQWLTQIGFNAAAGQFAILPASDSSIAAVFVGQHRAFLDVLTHLPSQLPSGTYTLVCQADEKSLQQAHLGWLLAAYQFNRYRSNQPAAPPVLLIPDELKANVTRQYEATALVRDLINTPTEDMGPDELQAACEQVAERFDAHAEVIDGEMLETHFPAIHAVGRASHRAPRLLRMTWGNPSNPTIAIVGKGVCFDTGGLNIKGGAGMRHMKKDMGGAAHALALAQMLMDAELPIQVELYIAAVENAIDSNAYRPGDVVATRKGLTVEIGNTDAEGRVVLADALAFASEQQPDLMIDFATLTGAARIALGTDLPAMFCNRDKLRQAFHQVATSSNDPIWPMPLYQPYMRYLKSDIADINNNASSPKGGAITAALFLQQFIGQSIDWCHFDTYGWNDTDRPGRPSGGEAMGLRASFEYIRQRYTDSLSNTN